MYNSIQNVAKSEALEGLQQETQVQIFSNNEFGQVRTTLNENGEPLFCLSDVCKILKITNPSDVVKRLNDGGVEKIEVCVNRGLRGDNTQVIDKTFINFINEMNLYKVIMRSNKPNAEKFQDWVCGEVLPTIRKTGSYNIQQQLPQDYLSALKALVKSEEEKQQLALENARLDKENFELEQEKNTANVKVSMALDYIKNVNPKARSWEKLANTDGLFTISQFASKIGLTAYKVNKFLVEKGIITNNKQRPTYKYIDKHFFECKELLITTQYGQKKTTRMFITTLGEEFVTNLLYQNGIINITCLK